MTATITQILTALDVGARGGACVLPLDADLYPPACLRSAAEAFAHVCTAEIRDTPAGCELAWTASGQDEPGRALGDFLNYALQSAVRMRQKSQ